MGCHGFFGTLLNSPIDFRKTLIIAVSNVNESPGITTAVQAGAVPGEDHIVTGLAISDDDPGALLGNFIVTLRVANGTLTLDESGLPQGAVTGNGGALVTVTAPATAINATFAGVRGLVYRSNVPFAGIENLVVEVNDNGNTDAGVPVIAVVTLSIEVHLNAFEEWRVDSFTAAQLLDLDLSGILGNGDGGNRINLVEFGLGTDPTISGDDSDNVDIGEVTIGADCHLTLTYTRRTTAADPLLTITPQLATDASNWRSGPSVFVGVSVVPLSSTFERITVRAVRSKSAQARALVRLEFTRRNAP